MYRRFWFNFQQADTFDNPTVILFDPVAVYRPSRPPGGRR